MTKSRAFLKYTFLVGVLFLFPLSLILFFGVFTRHSFNTLPYFGPHEVNALTGDTTYYKLPDFSLTNQDGEAVNLETLSGTVWLAAFYSTNSPHIRKITARLLWPNFRYRNKSDIRIVSFTLDPDHDTPEVLKDYVEQMTTYHDFTGKWQYLTGDKATLFSYISEGFLIDDPENTALFYLVDTDGHLRGVYNGNLEDEVKDAIEDIALLKKEIDLRAHEARKREKNAARNR